MALELWGAGAFGAVLGWNLYFVNRYRTDGLGIADLGALVGVVGGGAVMALFPSGTALFGAYGLGLLVGFLAYLAVLLEMVRRSDNFTVDWFLDGRRKRLAEDQEEDGRRTNAPMTTPHHEVHG
ncbi:hypothetical protein ACFV4N_32910 [Actinosynnema sp. NPDC059797]